MKICILIASGGFRGCFGDWSIRASTLNPCVAPWAKLILDSPRLISHEGQLCFINIQYLVFQSGLSYACHMDITWVSHGYHIYMCHMDITWVLHGLSHVTLLTLHQFCLWWIMLFWSCHMHATWTSHGCHMDITWCYIGYHLYCKHVLTLPQFCLWWIMLFLILSYAWHMDITWVSHGHHMVLHGLSPVL